MPLELIDKKDNFELIRDEIAAILAVETVNQQAKAVAAAKDPDLWTFEVYTERSRIWESLKMDSEEVRFPVVNVWFESASFPGGQNYNSLLQTCEGIFNIDIFAAAKDIKSAGTGFVSGDAKAAEDVQRITRLARNILWSVPPDTSQPGENYPYLNLRGIVAHKNLSNFQIFQPDIDNQAVHIVAARIAMMVKYIESGQEGPSENFELLQTVVKRAEDGQIIFEAQFDLIP